ncbi:hypothetical protein KO481_16170 [Nocardia sp. NEAU-G5]|uniref:Uncharacterized protein n=1 Tax=Nocardia albiluteola TaxID=2842303 RepID=A0ABS6B0U1_9NOCA|nr:hypothetical protein [Nocardia albiluteola]MBU3063056.1 hypothetical protein [Nocardia albiluteola]
MSDADSNSRFLRLTEDVPAPPTLANLTRKYGVSGSDDMEIELFDGFGMKQRVSLAPFAELDPDTYIKIMFLSAPAEREFPELEPGAVLLKEYLVAGPDE